jgi:hypothetical protein
VELELVGEHQRERVAGLQAELRQTGGQRVDPLAEVAPRDGELVTLRADGDIAGVVRGRLVERLDDGLRPDVLLELGLGVLDGAALHQPSPLLLLTTRPGR